MTGKTLEMPEVLADRYQIKEKLGQGGMATVYRAVQIGLDREVAIKILRTDTPWDQTSLARFMQEAKSVARLQHPNILAVYDFGSHQDVPFIVVPLMPGGTLKDLMKAKLPLPRVIALLEQLAAAIDYAHEQGIIHRDLKPGNVLISSQGDALLADFGIAKVADSGLTMTQTGVTFGTPDYMAPEQGLGQKIDGRADLYALGIMAFEMLTGRVPFTADTPLGVAVKHCNERLPSVRHANGELPPAVDAALDKACAKKPEERHATCREFVEDLKRACAVAGGETSLFSAAALQQVEARPATIPPPQPAAAASPVAAAPRRPARFKWVLAGGAFVVLFLALAGGAIAYYMMSGAAKKVTAQEARTIAQTFLDEYSASLADFNLSRHMNCYNDTMEVYFRKRNVDFPDIERDKQKLINKFSDRMSTRFTSLSADPLSGNRIRIRFDKSWDYEGPDGVVSGENRSGEMILAQVNSQWKLISEKDGEATRREAISSPDILITIRTTSSSRQASSAEQRGTTTTVPPDYSTVPASQPQPPADHRTTTVPSQRQGNQEPKPGEVFRAFGEMVERMDRNTGE